MRFFSFTKADKILKRSEFLQLSRLGKKISNSHFVLLYAPGQFERSRLGITVTKKVGNAVVRNRIKRFSREYFRLNRHNIKGYWDFNLIAKKEAAELTSRQAFMSLQNVFGRIEAN
ncbi:ribonuclease P protein component [Thermodesulfobacteriota bacterium]